MALNTIRRLTITITSRCMSNCLYCSYSTGSGRDFPREKLLSLLQDANAAGVRAVRLTGGEPSLYSRLDELVGALYKYGMASMICTNLRAPARLWKGVVDAGLDVLSVSLDSLDPTLFEQLRGYRLAPVLKRLDALALLREHVPFEIVLSVVLTPLNLSSVTDIVQFALERDLLLSLTAVTLEKGFAAARIAPLRFKPEHEQVLKNVLDSVEAASALGLRLVNGHSYYWALPDVCLPNRARSRGVCRAGSDEAIVTLDGKLKLCHLLPGVPCKGSLAETWNSPPMDRVRQRIMARRCPGCRLSCHMDERRDAPLHYGRARASALL